MDERPAVTDRVLRHVVLIGFKPAATEAEIRQIEDAFRRLPEQINAIHDLEWGTNVSVEGIARGYTHCFFLTFLSEQDRDAYLPHPAHRAFGTVLRPVAESVLVIDYWTQR